MTNKQEPRLPRRPVAAVLVLAIALLAGCSNPATDSAQPTPEAASGLPTGFDNAEALIDRDLLESHIARLASDELEGRAPASRGEELALAYLARTMAELGLEPGGPDGEWEQRFDIVGVTSSPPETWRFVGSEASPSFDFWEEYIAASGVQTESARVDDAELVFVGYGIEAPEHQWDDFKGADLEDKILLMLNNDPDWDPGLFEGETRLYYGRWTYKYESAARQGAVGAVIIHTTPSAGYPWQVVQTSWTGEQFQLPAGDEPRCQVQAWLTEDAARELVAAAGHDLDELTAAARSRDFRPVPLGIRTSLELANEVRTVQTANVAGVLRGGDPELGDEVVVYTAHHDHFGIGEPDDSGDRIYNGARDNASGVAQVLAVASAFRALPEPPRRSILFLLVAAEEQGLLGSAHYSANPTFHPGRFAANINLDGGNIWGRTADISYIGYGKSSLDGVVEAAAARQGRRVVGDQFPDRGHFYRSDQFNFAKIGVPAIYLDQGSEFIGQPAGWGKEQVEAWEASNYHQPGDELDESWNFDGMIEDTRLAFECGARIAQQDDLPAWKAGDEFEAARLAALAE